MLYQVAQSIDCISRWLSYNSAMSKKYDLHSHSTASDGTLTPTQLLAHAASQGVDVLALTDHDTVAGLDEARTAAAEHGIQLINGAELSLTWNKLTLHVVALGLDPEYPPLRDGRSLLRRRHRAGYG